MITSHKYIPVSKHQGFKMLFRKSQIQNNGLWL
uniref:Uncharacterized protein n=1 Tax=Arundo donax TaxID=35708 RepID=A0A0A8ZNV6_ARUDO